MRRVARDAQRHGMQFVSIAADEVLPRALILNYRGRKATSWKACTGPRHARVGVLEWGFGEPRVFVLSCPEDSMRLGLAVGGIAPLIFAAIVVPCLLDAGEVSPSSGYALLDPIRSGNLALFPVVANKSYDTGQFLTLHESLRSREVAVTEA